MPRFFFHYRGPDDLVIEDHLGSEQSDLEAVEREAHLVACDILEDELRQGGPLLATRCLEIEDESGEIVLLLPFWASFAARRGNDASTSAIH
jgi:hypothetical protein